MKAKVILTSTAVLGMLTACQQDDLAFVETSAPAEVAARPVAGKAVINANSDETRFNTETGAFTEGDKIGLFLMDAFQNAGEALDANTTTWKQMPTWWTMYDFVDYINSNYLYTKKGNEFVNPGAQLVEGNYFLLFDPESSKNEKAYMNRQNLWKALSTKVTLNDYTANTTYNKYEWGGLFGVLSNQFYLDYKQIYRDADAVNADGELVIDAELKPILAKVKADVINESAFKYRIKEIRITPKTGVKVPNIAYIQPKTKNLKAVLPTTGTYANTRKSFTQEMARGIVAYDVISGLSTDKIPYGYNGEKNQAPYFAVEFPGEGHIVAAHTGDISMKQGLEAIFTMPKWESFKESTVEIYAEKYDPFLPNEEGGLGVWVPGYFNKDNVNGVWTMNSMSFDEVNTGRLYFDDHAFQPYSAYTAAIKNSQELYDIVKAKLADNWLAKIEFKVADGANVEITKELNDMIETYEATYGKDIVVSLEPNAPNKNTTVTVKDANLMNDNYELLFPAANNDAIVLAADQKLDKNYDQNIQVNGAISLDLNGKTISALTNNGTVTITSNGTIGGTNKGTMNINEGVTVKTYGEFKNEKTMNIDGTIYSETGNKFINNGTVVAGDKAEITISSGSGTLDLRKVTVKAPGTQNHIEVVSASNTTILWKSAEGDLKKQVENNVGVVVAQHNLKDAKEVKVYLETSSLTNSATTASPLPAWWTAGNVVTFIVTEKAAVATVDYSTANKVEFQEDLTVSGAFKVKTIGVNYAEVLANASIEVTAAGSTIGNGIKLYENALLAGAFSATGGKVQGYTSQVKWTGVTIVTNL